jgi:hypothetical protein
MSDSEDVKLITDQLEATYQALRVAAANISGLLSMGVATCDEVKAYNLWALATYNAQRGMLATLAANGESGVPALPAYPTLFVWADQSGEDAVNVDCSGQDSSLSGSMSRALRGPTDQSVYLGLDKIKIVTTDQYAYNPENSPSFQTLLKAQTPGLGIGPLAVLIIVAGIALTVSFAISALLEYLKASKLDEEVTKQTKQQADAFANYTGARVQCYQGCIGQGGTAADCVATCKKLVDKPDIKISCLPGQPNCNQWGLLQWIGVTVVIGIGGIITYKLWDRHRRGEPLIPDFHLPEAHMLPSSL